MNDAALLAPGATEAPAVPRRATKAGAPRRTGYPVGIVAGVVLAVLTLPITVAAIVQGANEIADWMPWVSISAAALLHVVAAFSWRRPRGALVAGAALMLVLAVIPFDPTATAAMLPSSLAFLLVVLGAARAPEARVGRAGLTIGLVGAVIVPIAHRLVVRAGPLHDDLVVQAFAAGGLAAAIVASWALGRLARSVEQRELERERARIRDAISDERRNISRDLHDVIAHSMTVMIAQAEAGGVAVKNDPDAAVASLARIAEQGRVTMSDLRAMLRVLERPEDDASLSPVPGLDALASLVEHARDEGREITLRERGDRRPLARDAELAVHRTVQEALTNAIRHRTRPLRVCVDLDWHVDRLDVAITDDGGGGPAGAEGGGRGIIGMRERVERAGGSLEIAQDRGWIVRFSVPSDPSPHSMTGVVDG